MTFGDYLSRNEGKEISLNVYNIISQATRPVLLTLHRNWGDHQSIFGGVIRLECYTDSHLHILAVKDVLLSSPAHQAELQPFRDFIVGTREIAFKGIDEFAKYVEVNAGREIRLWVYNIDQEVVREVALTPKGDWGG